MKKFLFPFLLLILPVILFGQNKVIISGTVTNSFNSQPVKHHEVLIKSDPAQTSGFDYNHSVFTNHQGIFADTFLTSYEKGDLIVYIYDCNNNKDSANISFALTNLHQAINFTICDSGIFFTNCDAQFTYSIDTIYQNTVHFLGTATGGGNFGYSWNFGDGTTSTLQSPTHVYPNNGLYYVSFIANSPYCIDSAYTYVNLQNPSPCQAQFTYTVNNLLASFNSLIYGNYTQIEWDFGDGCFSNDTCPSHTYTSPGFYQVCLSIYNSYTGCSDNFCIPLEIGIIVNYDLCGQVFGTVYPISEGIAHLFRKMGNSLYYTSSCTFSTNGYYWFHQIPASEYVVFIDPLATVSSEILCPGYLGDALRWQNSPSINVNHNIYDADINLLPIEPTYGSCSVSGNIVSGPDYIPPFGSILSHNLIYLFNTNWEPVAFCFTSPDGSFYFNNIDYGTYYLTAEITGRYSDVITITLSPGIPVINNLSLLLNGPMGITEVVDNSFSGAIVFPNPVVNEANLNINIISEGKYSFQIINMTGAVLYKETQILSKGNHKLTFDTKEFSQGAYLITIIKSDSKQFQAIRFIK
ncbi:MAG: PKD domain-containing protein [Bacteroidota bacterium]